jgi:hypothetical protein
MNAISLAHAAILSKLVLRKKRFVWKFVPNAIPFSLENRNSSTVPGGWRNSRKSTVIYLNNHNASRAEKYKGEV